LGGHSGAQKEPLATLKDQRILLRIGRERKEARGKKGGEKKNFRRAIKESDRKLACPDPLIMRKERKSYLVSFYRNRKKYYCFSKPAGARKQKKPGSGHDSSPFWWD